MQIRVIHNLYKKLSLFERSLAFRWSNNFKIVHRHLNLMHVLISSLDNSVDLVDTAEH